MNLKKLTTLLFAGVTAATPFATNAQNPTILQGNYVSNVFGQANFVLNPNAQTNVANVNVTNATRTRSTTTPLVATTEFNVTVTSANGTATWATRSFDAGMKNQNCEARFTYRGFQATSKAQIKQGANVVAELTLTPSATDPRIASINFPCGDLSSATTFVITDTATLSGTNEIGGIYVGLATNMANVAQAESVLNALHGVAQNIPSNVPTDIIYDTVISDRYGSYNSSTGVYTVRKSGTYLINAKATMTSGTINVGNYIELKAFLNTTQACRSYENAPYTGFYPIQKQIGCQIEANAGDTIKIAIQFQFSARDTIAQEGYTDLQISRFPSSSELVVTPETQNWFVDGYHTGDNPSLGVIAVGTRTEITNPTMTFTPKTGSAPVATLCSSTNPPPALSTSTTTCAAGNESMGITFNIPSAGIYKVCSEFQPNINVAAAGHVDLYMFLEETATNANTALTTNRSVNRYFVSTSSANNMTTPIRMCENFNFASVGQKAIRIMYKQTVSGTVNSAIIVADNYNERGIKWTVEPYKNNSNSALYVQGPVKGSGTGAAIPAGSIGEEKIAYATDTFTVSANVEVDVTGASITLEPGVWDIEYSATVLAERTPASTQSLQCRLRIRDSANNVETLTESGIGLSSNTSDISWNFFEMSKKKRLTLTSTKTYKLSLTSRSNNTVANCAAFTGTTTGSISGSEATTYIRAVRIN